MEQGRADNERAYRAVCEAIFAHIDANGGKPPEHICITPGLYALVSGELTLHATGRATLHGIGVSRISGHAGECVVCGKITEVAV